MTEHYHKLTKLPRVCIERAGGDIVDIASEPRGLMYLPCAGQGGERCAAADGHSAHRCAHETIL
eukprot:4959552-Pyramimonas_sp.AAC.1